MTRLAVPALLAVGWVVCARRLAATRADLAGERELVANVGATIDGIADVVGQARYAAGYKAGHAKGYRDGCADALVPATTTDPEMN